MNIETKIADVDREIKALEPYANDAWTDYNRMREELEKKINNARDRWISHCSKIGELNGRKRVLQEMQKDCECVISIGVPVADEDIGRTVPIGEEQDYRRTPVFNNGQENEHLAPNG